MSDRKFKKGDKVETIHGEKVTVLDVKTTDEVTKKGVVIKKKQQWVLVKSGGTTMRESNDPKKAGVMEEVELTIWFPENKIKE